MQNQLNIYGDHRRATPGNHGVDIAAQRADDLDNLAIERVRQLQLNGRSTVRALDVGRGLLVFSAISDGTQS
ncbi:hypothetical protein [Burkholderia sp. LMG 13014]|uniref:hypothetical protein n=1 Tax=Burkholderia sp. LMG 13014 TaxID=2709306 RepID=UPI00196509C1|nr:hypothetical protein [Burkholderia sp. LMG 13014]